MSVVGLVATLKSFPIFGKIYRFRTQFASALDCRGRCPEFHSPGAFDPVRYRTRRWRRFRVSVFPRASAARETEVLLRHIFGFDDEGGETFSLIWSRGRRSNGD